ncbi:hypothetical protein OQH61_01705 [Helicobacter sp. MIT 21-1697]|uniref:hypothetical protein n=1 Tax=Helicobacter sp. MIT 21-1697 TaxID=2993733 RepID=UPI00224B8C3F|nr:hypothetical protein [Helicobacter sp. MIT 21-1697]MCX2716454.1 hypothetical protein [Helicobacter sp. MIT 21-1697]
MSLFRVNMPPIPDNIPIHTIEHTPLLKRAKWLQIIPILISLILLSIVIFMGTQSAEELIMLSSTATIAINILSFCNIICIFFSYYLLSKLSLRRRLFNLYLAYFGLILFIVFLAFVLNFLGGSSSFNNTISAIIMCIIYIVLIYIYWQISKELSFILNEPLFFKGFKLALFGTIIVGITTFIALFIYAAYSGSSSLPASTNFILIIDAIILFIGAILAIFGSVFYIIGIFKIKEVIAWGEQTPNLIS